MDTTHSGLHFPPPFIEIRRVIVILSAQIGLPPNGMYKFFWSKKTFPEIWPNGKVVAWARSDNIASIRTLEKVHFQRENMEKERVRFVITLNG